MHTLDFNNGDEVIYIHHNGDYSGDVIINVAPERVEQNGPMDFGIHVPFAALKELVANYVRSEFMDRLEGADADRILLGSKHREQGSTAGHETQGH